MIEIIYDHRMPLWDSELESIHKDTVGENNYLHELLNQARHRKYVTNSDRPKYEQLSIFNEAEAFADPTVSEPELPETEAEDNTKKSKRGKRPSKIKKNKY